jgi:hypothetical protein
MMLLSRGRYVLCGMAAALAAAAGGALAPARPQKSPSDGAGVDCSRPLRYSICEDRLGLFAR